MNLATNRPGDHYFIGYNAEFPHDLFTWNMQELAIEHLTTYFADRVPDRPLDHQEAIAIYHATHGVPLAIRQSADLWMQGVPLTEIIGEHSEYVSRDKIVREMHHRVLLHVETDALGEDDKRALYLLAMQPHPDSRVQQAVLSIEKDKFDLGRYLAELAQRYSTVQLEGGARLHDAMCDFMQEYLMMSEMRHSNLVTQIADQAVKTLYACRTELTEDLFDLEERVASEDWQQTTLDLIHWLFWQSEKQAWRELVPRFVEGLGYDRKFAQSLLSIADNFKPALSKNGRKRLNDFQLQDENSDSMLRELERLANKGNWLDDRDVNATDERHAILLMLRGGWLLNNKQYEEAWQVFRATEQRLPDNAKTLRKRLGQAISGLAADLFTANPEKISLETKLIIAKQAVILDKEYPRAWYRLGANLWNAGQYQEAIESFQRAIELDPKYAHPHHGLAIVYSALGRDEEAIEELRRAIEIKPDWPTLYSTLSMVYGYLGRYEKAVEALQRAIELEPDNMEYRDELTELLQKLEFGDGSD